MYNRIDLMKERARRRAWRYRIKHNIPPDPLELVFVFIALAYPVTICACLFWQMMPASLFLLLPLFFGKRD